jgi:hypothetical protein
VTGLEQGAKDGAPEPAGTAGDENGASCVLRAHHLTPPSATHAISHKSSTGLEAAVPRTA